LIWWHKPITSPLEITAIGNFHQVHDATAAGNDDRLVRAPAFFIDSRTKERHGEPEVGLEFFEPTAALGHAPSDNK
jgi:hypothetical protein